MFLFRKKIRENRKNFYISAFCCGIIFVMGLLYILIPFGYGLENMEFINTNYLFVCMMLILASVSFGEYVLVTRKMTDENIFFSIMCACLGILNVFMSYLTSADVRLSVSFLLFIVLYGVIKCFVIEYYANKKDALQYIELLITIPFLLVSIALCLSFNGSMIAKTISMGFIMVLYAVLESIKVSFRTMLKSKRFINKIKLK